MDSLVKVDTDLGKLGEALLNKIGEGVTGIAKPWQTRRVARAEADAILIKQKAELKAKGMEDAYAARLMAEEARRQINMDRVIEGAMPQLTASARPGDIENDWVAYFFDRCKVFSDEGVQKVWSRILAGEANSPGSFSRKTIDCLQALDMADAKDFSALCSYMIRKDGKLVACVFDPSDDVYAKLGKGYGKLQQLESLGLLTVVFSAFSSTGVCVIKVKGEVTILEYFGQKIRITNAQHEDYQLPVGCIRLTRSGRELAEICHAELIQGFVDYALGHWRQRGGIRAELI